MEGPYVTSPPTLKTRHHTSLGCEHVPPPMVTCVLVSRFSFLSLGTKYKQQFPPNSSAWSLGYLVTERMGTPSVLGSPGIKPLLFLR